MALSSLADHRADASAAWSRSSGTASTSGRDAAPEQLLWHRQLSGRRRQTHVCVHLRRIVRREVAALQSSTLEEARAAPAIADESGQQHREVCPTPITTPTHPHPQPFKCSSVMTSQLQAQVQHQAVLEAPTHSNDSSSGGSSFLSGRAKNGVGVSVSKPLQTPTTISRLRIRAIFQHTGLCLTLLSTLARQPPAQ